MSSSRRRLLRLVLTGLVVLLLAGYGAFTTFFFNPFEADYEFDVATLVPRDVDFFTAKADLEQDFDPFPVPAFAEELQASAAGQVLDRQVWYQDLLRELDVAGAIASLEEALSQAPVDVDPLGLFGGEDLALAGYFEGAELADARWAVLGRTGWIGKFGVELLDRPGWIGLDAQGITAEPVRATIQAKEQDVGVTLSGGQLTRPLTVARISDVVVLSVDPELAVAVARLASVRGEDSFGLSAKFADRIDVERRDGDELELFVDSVKLSRAMGWDTAWPDRGADTFFSAFLGRLFQLSFVNELAGRLAFAGGLTLDLEGQLSSEQLNSTQKRLYRQRHLDKNALRQMAFLAPSDVGLFVTLRGGVSDLLTAALESIDEGSLQLFEDLVLDVWGYQDPSQLIQDLDEALQGKATFFVRANDYPAKADDPPNDGATVLAWALALVPEDSEKLKKVLDQIRTKPRAFGLERVGNEGNGIYTIPASTGSIITEYMNPLVPGTGQIATLDVRVNETYFLVSNSRNFLGHIDETLNDINGALSRSLGSRVEFEAFVNTGLPSASALAWVDPRAIGPTLRKIFEETVRIQARSQIDWNSIRPGVEREVSRDNFGGATPGSLSNTQTEEFERLVEMRLDAIETEKVSETAPALRQAAFDRISLWEGVRTGLFELALDPKELAFHARLAIPLDPPQVAGTP